MARCTCSHRAFHEGTKLRVYALTDPRDRRVRYVGKSIHPRHRLQGHCAPLAPKLMRGWVLELRRLGLRPQLVVLYEVPAGDDGVRAERFFIGLFEQLAPGTLLNRQLGDVSHGRDAATTFAPTDAVMKPTEAA